MCYIENKIHGKKTSTQLYVIQSKRKYLGGQNTQIEEQNAGKIIVKGTATSVLCVHKNFVRAIVVLGGEYLDVFFRSTYFRFGTKTPRFVSY